MEKRKSDKWNTNSTTKLIKVSVGARTDVQSLSQLKGISGNNKRNGRFRRVWI